MSSPIFGSRSRTAPSGRRKTAWSSMPTAAGGGRLPLEPGTPVYEGQSLFLIPDLSRMEVNVSVHESMGPRVRAGMKAKVRIASRPDRVIAGSVAAIEMLSTPELERVGRERAALPRAGSARPDAAECPAVHVGHGRDRHRPRLRRTRHSRRGRGRRRRPAVVLCRHRRRPRTADDQDSPRDPRPGGGHRRVSTKESASYHGRSTSTKSPLATRFMNRTATSRAIKLSPAVPPAKQYTFIPPAR